MKIIKLTLALSFTILALLSTIVSAQEVPIPDIPVVGDGTDSGFQTDFMKWQQDELLRRMLLDQMNAALAAAAAEAGRQAAAQAAAAAAASEAENRRRRTECGARRGGIEGGRSGCRYTAGRNRTTRVASCPVETGIDTSLTSPIGSVNVTTNPRAACLELAQYEMDTAFLECDYIAELKKLELPLYCYSE